MMKRLIPIALGAFLSTFFLTACTSSSTKEDVGTAIGAVVGAIAGYKIGGDKNKELGAIVGGGVGAVIGKGIGRYLDERDQQRMTQSTQQALVSGQTQTWSNPENKTSGSARVVETRKEPKPVVIPVLKEKVKQVPPLDIIGDTYRSKSESNVRGGPGTDYVKVGRLQSGETVNVVGKVKANDWYLISQDGAGSGFVSVPLLEHAPGASIASAGTTVSPSDVAEQTVASERVCRTIEQTVSLPDGSKKSETLEACQGGDGWKVSS
ncbi:SH3 domain-containing protein [Pseudomonas fluorescens]|uniref:SH3 domain-containing protein n=2 Tax=Pseudomonas fluorescens TaxID=294 RepID=A0A944DN08_PSEFL|nr:SH3 domain-containing protein [Pseudomonas fluorescens]MBT2316781.1 SH3 domain-containing protein [Pseudomonas fluorescens]MBT2329790.1 SH3 domain-containing protein [Pseudomonas fluorescens]MBT2344600.1 SH3 domain-containing protein [Pseudomonas fluorescens]MBT2348010.1 SH3 domain-containing protein [Pseudomonas fluorescens]